MINHNIPATSSMTKQPDNLLFRSRIEICRTLQSLAQERCKLYAEVGSRKFESFILLVNTQNDHIVISYWKNKEVNSKLLKQHSLRFTAVYHDAQIVFEVLNPTEVLFEGQPAIQYDLPKILISHHLREQPRIPIPVEASLRCVADENGFVPFESYICDISQDGLGCILYDRDVKLEPGVILNGCRIIIPGGKAVVADIKLCHIEMVTLPDGHPAIEQVSASLKGRMIYTS
ncbi:MAG: flagellar regulator YcgR PilZN domain-containing protein [Nitrosomonadales bacterium]